MIILPEGVKAFVIKFCSESIKDVKSILNVVKFIASFTKGDKYLLLFPAFPGAQEILEKLFNAYWLQNQKEVRKYLAEFREINLKIIAGFCKKDPNYQPFTYFEKMVDEMSLYLDKKPKNPLDENERIKSFSHLMHFGEAASTYILEYIINEYQTPTGFVKASRIIKTKKSENKWNRFFTNLAITEILVPEFLNVDVIISQSTMGSNDVGEIVYLDYLSSDFSAIVFASSLKAEVIYLTKFIGVEDEIDDFIYENMTHQSFLNEGTEMILKEGVVKVAEELGVSFYIRKYDNPDFPGTKVFTSA